METIVLGPSLRCPSCGHKPPYVWPEDFDAYGKDLPIPTSGKDNVYRLKIGTFELLSDEETKAYRDSGKEAPQPKRRKE